jgi:hypothetical protein
LEFVATGSDYNNIVVNSHRYELSSWLTHSHFVASFHQGISKDVVVPTFNATDVCPEH